ncbi:MAG: FMN-binding protein [Oscillospiraceae bacterium]
MSMVKEFIYPTFILAIVCFIISLALAVTFKVTDPIIQAAIKSDADFARTQVFTGDSNFTQINLTTSVENCTEIYKANNNSGYVFTTASKGFGGTMTVMVGMDADSKITGVKLMTHNETPGLGTKTSEPSFTDQFIGIEAEQIDPDVDSISGATISSNAFKRAVQVAFLAFEEVKKGGQ